MDKTSLYNTDNLQQNTLDMIIFAVLKFLDSYLHFILTFISSVFNLFDSTPSESESVMNNDIGKQGDDDESFGDFKEKYSNFYTSISPSRPTLIPLIIYKQEKDYSSVQENREEICNHQSLFNRRLPYNVSKNIERVPQICQVRHITVSGHRPSKINQIPWDLMNKEWWRLHTFSKYPRNAPCSAIVLARQGFVYIGNGNLNDDTIICVFCLSAVKDLDSTVNITSLHYSLNQNCPTVRGLECGNMLMKEHDYSSTIELISVLSSFEKKEHLTVMTDGQQNENETSSLKVDYPKAGNTHVAPIPVPALPREVMETTNSSRPLNENTSHDTYLQASGNGASEFVTNHAQSLYLSEQHVVDSNSTQNAVRTEQVKTAAAIPNNVPSSASAPITSSNQSAHRDESNSPSNNHQRHSDLSRPQPNTGPSNITTNRPNSPRNTESAPSPQSQTVSDSSQPAQGTAASYEKLGIITARPKRYEYAIEVTRLQSYDGWPEGHHIKKEDLAKAGFFYTGYSDCARCFYCGGGLRNWEVDDDVWVEHARWFAKCYFIRQCVGQPFIDVVQELSQERETIPYEDIIDEMKSRGLEHSIPKGVKDKTSELERDPAVKTIIDNGFNKEDVIKAAEALQDTGMLLAAEALFDELRNKNAVKSSVAVKKGNDSLSVSKKGTAQQNKKTIQSLKDENSQLRQQSQCKICMDKEVSMVFLPCGHFISCHDCSYALKSCPVCRDSIKGCVRAHLN